MDCGAPEMKHAWTLAVAAVLIAGPSPAQESAAERGRKALTSRSFTPASWSVAAYENLWKLWDRTLAAAPGDYDRLVRERYGLHAAPFENGRYPMGLREGKSLLG